jgi:hypothetical protein
LVAERPDLLQALLGYRWQLWRVWHLIIFLLKVVIIIARVYVGQLAIRIRVMAIIGVILGQEVGLL